MDLNCIKCGYRHENTGNCTVVGGFCTAVPAAHCQLLKAYQATGLSPEGVEEMKRKLLAAIKDIDRSCASCAYSSKNNGTGKNCGHRDCDLEEGHHWQWRGITKEERIDGKN